MARPRIAIPATASGGKSFAKKTKTNSRTPIPDGEIRLI